MFMIDPNPNREMKIILRSLKKNLGQVPPHFELFATVNPKRFKMFLEEITYLSRHEHINPDFFAFLRYYVASKNCFSYCVKFNRGLLLSKNYSEEVLDRVAISADDLPLDANHKALFREAITAIEEPEKFTTSSIESLKTLGWSDADIYDAVDHAAFLFKFSKVLRAYSKE